VRQVIVGVVALAIAVPGIVATVHLAVLGVASLFYREPRTVREVPRVRFLVVVPAHNEELVLSHTLGAICANLRHDDQLLVVDDRSTDRTGEIAAAHGAIVVRRHPGSEPGRAAARQTAIEYSRRLQWDAMVMIDADSVVEPGFFNACERMLATGAPTLQARSEAARGRRLVDQAALASFAIQGVVMPRGRDALGLLVRLRGSGMVLRREVVERFRFRAPASEDLVYSLDLCTAGVRVRHVDSARMRSHNAGSWRTASQQKLRYEVGRMAAGRQFLRSLVRTRTLAGLEAAWFLVSPPFATAATLLLAGLAISLFGAPIWVVGLLAVLVAALFAVLLLGIVEARLSPRVFAALAVAPAYLAWKLVVQVRAAVILRSGPREFGATPR
jgi:1,2-diacylglycerol 3-beta-glucosyltransferase